MNNNNSLVNFLAYAVGIFLALAFFALIFLYAAWACAFVSVHLWAWFVIPTFGLAPLKLSSAFGISLLVGLWTHQHRTNNAKDERDAKEKAIEAGGILLSPWLILFFGYVCHTYFM